MNFIEATKCFGALQKNIKGETSPVSGPGAKSGPIPQGTCEEKKKEEGPPASCSLPPV